MSQNTKKNPSRKKVALGMSGGVDSSLCAHLLIEQGYDVTGVYLECWRAPGCRTEEDRKDALKVALKLDIPFKVLDFKRAYRDRVVQYFFDEYKKGKTPNPDVMCNKEIKFGLFYDWAMEQGFDFVATGHYAKILEIKEQKHLVIPKDTHKDQTYFLYLMDQNQVEHTLFPLAEIEKKDVRAEAEKRNIHVSNKKDSVGICFIGDINVHEFLKEELGENPGEVVNSNRDIIGVHKGLWFYTIGQRHGFEINKKTVITLENGETITKQNIPPFYVIKKLPEKNQLMVGFGAETYTDSFGVSDMHWISRDYQTESIEKDLFVRIRHTGELIACSIKKKENSAEYQVTLTKQTKGIAEGQAAVFYLKENFRFTCLGGGAIS